MLSRLLGLLVLSSLCSAMLLSNGTSSGGDPRSDPNTHYWPGTNKGQLPMEEGSAWAQIGRSFGSVPPPGNPLPPTGNMTGPDMLRMIGDTGSTTPTMPDTTICDLLFSAPVPPPIDQIPLFCICSHCKGTVGPKGDHGDRGPPGMWSILKRLCPTAAF